MKRLFVVSVSGMALGALLNGCGQGGIDKKAFAHADPAVKQRWETALAADRANDYLAANTNLVALLNQAITPEQTVAVQNVLRKLNERMRAAADKGDVSAQKAVETLEAMRPQQGRGRQRTSQ
jgi:hypothetical protein